MDRPADLAYRNSMKSPVHILRRLWQRGVERRRRARFTKALRHVHGPVGDTLPQDAILAIVLVRNGSYYMDAFLAHYRAMGVTHFAFIDNGSTDDTQARVMAEPDTILDHCALPLAGYEDLIRQYPAQTYGRNRWCLYVDMDEVFDFEGRREIGLPGLIRYLEGQGATALVAQMLEMFPKAPLSAVASFSFTQSLEDFAYFDISAVRKYAYHSPDIPFAALLKGNIVPDPAVQFYFGGVRGKVFGENCCLTKHPLIYNGPGVSPAPHPHLSVGVTCAEITGVIKHYKFAGDTAARDAASLGTGDLAHGEDAARAAVLSQRPDVSLFSLDARRWNRVELLKRTGFILGSDRYSDYLAQERA
ncbi:Glyco tranf 2 4 domain containing protein [Sulfitobacter noctilucae]|uniref:glycosyltransferase family 2 protein n=1 Tax=Sulfitobacter noctilucae TaxID=1342302 RepID=UPI000AC8D02E|nr:glycosyltransferase family 2 protein [Sulfitobacter noctilucae]KIN61607.1 Glyco tranf 2 4 domain containing protein [Sulfitobacter noctilucae]